MKTHKATGRQWGDPMDYADVMNAKNALVKPNKFICIRCHQQAIKESDIKHTEGCPETKKKV